MPDRSGGASGVLSRLERWAEDLLLPPRCARCDVDLPPPCPVFLCDACQQSLFQPDERFCPQCAYPCPPGRTWASCPECSRARFRFDSALALGVYRGPLRDAILAMKHPRGELLSRAIGQLLALHRAGQIRPFDPDCVIPVPMYWARRIWRGVNSPQLLAEEMAGQLGVPVLGGVVRRHRNTTPQKNLGHADRFRNVRGAFVLGGGYDLSGARVLIVDDIMTSGATCSELARTLKTAGAAAVSALVVGRAAATA